MSPAARSTAARTASTVVRRVVAAAARLLGPGGSLLVELGGDQDRSLLPTLDASGFESADTWCDEDGDLRGIEARRGRRA